MNFVLWDTEKIYDLRHAIVDQSDGHIMIYLWTPEKFTRDQVIWYVHFAPHFAPPNGFTAIAHNMTHFSVSVFFIKIKEGGL